MANVIQFDAAQRRAAHVARLEQQRHEVEEAGNHAWGRLQKARKFNPNDRREIAKAMHEKLEDLKTRRPQLSVGELAKAAGLSNSKELYRLTLPPNEDPIKRGLRADAQKYVRLLKAIQRKTGENMAQLVDRLTWATSFHPKQTPGSEESERMMNYLQEVINRIDQEFSQLHGGETLHNTFRKTALIKAEMAKQGGWLRWPFYDLDVYLDDDSASNNASELMFPHPGLYLSSDFPQDLMPRREDDFDIRYAYWQRDYAHCDLYSRLSARSAYPSGVAHFDALMHLPRIYLGVVDLDSYFSVTVAQEDATRHFIQFEAEPGARQRAIERLKSRVGELGEIRDEAGNAYIAHRHPKSGELIQGLSGKYHGKYHSVYEDGHAWFVIYPSLNNTTLLPVLFLPDSDGGTLLIPMYERSLVSLREMLFVDAGEPRSLYDRIKELMRASSDRAIYKGWQETAEDVLSNPVLRAHKESLAKQDDFERGMAAIWDDN